MEKVQIGCGCYWCDSGDLFHFYFKLLHSNLVGVCFCKQCCWLVDLGWLEAVSDGQFLRSANGGPPAIAPPEAGSGNLFPLPSSFSPSRRIALLVACLAEISVIH